MEKVTISDVWHLPLHLVKKETEPGKPNDDLEATAVVRVKAPPPLEVTKRYPIHLVVVIDATLPKEAPLLANKPSSLDLLKTALKFIMRQLHKGDLLGIVLKKNSRGKVIISEDTRTDDENMVDKLLARADRTTFKPDLEEAKKIFNEEGADKKHLCFIVLLSDGLGKSKFKWNDDKSLDDKKAALCGLANYPIHTFGLGKDHDPSALLFIANESKGTYSSITENVSNMLIEALAVCLGGLTNIVAVDTVINIKATQSDKGSTTITRIEGHGCIHPMKVNKTSCDINIGVLYAGEVKDLVVHFKVEIGYFKQGPSTYAPLSAKGQYMVIPGGESMPIQQLKPEFSVYARKMHKPYDEQRLLPFPVVIQQRVRNEVLRFVDSFLQNKYQELKTMAEEACRDLAVQIIAGNTLMQRWEEFKKKDKTWKNAQEIGLDVERIENDIEAMVRGLKRGRGVGCIYSWVSSNQMQRAATTGLPATSFLTPAMKKMVLEAPQIKLDAETPSSSAAGNTEPLGEDCMCKRATKLLDLLSNIDPEILRSLCSQVPQGQ